MKIFQFLSDLSFDQEMGFDALSGTYAATQFNWRGSDPATQKFVKAYQATYNKPPSGYAAYTYNATTGTNPKTVAQSTAGTWLFAASGTSGPFNQMHQQNPQATNDILAIFCNHLDMIEVPWTRASRDQIQIARKDAVARLDSFIGPKR